MYSILTGLRKNQHLIAIPLSGEVLWKRIKPNLNQRDTQFSEILIIRSSKTKQKKHMKNTWKTHEKLPPIDSNFLREKVVPWTKRLRVLNKAEQKQLKQLQQDFEKYESQLEKLGYLGSYSKSDEDATFIRMKEDWAVKTSL